MGEIRGILFAITAGKGSRSEGPKYFIKPLDDYKNRWSEILVRKKAHMWKIIQNCINFLIRKY